MDISFPLSGVSSCVGSGGSGGSIAQPWHWFSRWPQCWQWHHSVAPVGGGISGSGGGSSGISINGGGIGSGGSSSGSGIGRGGVARQWH